VQVIGGASTQQQLLRAGLVDELHIDVMPVVFGDGQRLLEDVDPDRWRLEKLGVEETGARTSLRLRVARNG
jgi:dihydrofolate reductase